MKEFNANFPQGIDRGPQRAVHDMFSSEPPDDLDKIPQEKMLQIELLGIVKQRRDNWLKIMRLINEP